MGLKKASVLAMAAAFLLTIATVNAQYSSPGYSANYSSDMYPSSSTYIVGNYSYAPSQNYSGQYQGNYVFGHNVSAYSYTTDNYPGFRPANRNYYSTLNYGNTSVTVNIYLTEQKQPGTYYPGAYQAHTTYHMQINDFYFNPDTMTLKKGDSVSWRNYGNAPHTVTGNSFDSGIIRRGESYTRTFNTAGTYYYYCRLHPEMSGKIIVK